MKQYRRSHIWPSFVLCMGLWGTAFMAQAHEDSAPSISGESAGEHSAHGNGYKGHHGKSHHAGHHDMGGKKGMHQQTRLELDLEDDQLKDIAEIQKELRSDLTDLKVERYEASLKLEELYAAEELDAGDIVDQQQKVFDVIKEITELQVEAQQEIRDLLTDEQKNKLLRSGGWLK
jgi:Spy/CpxP family protein refolding chaperone